MNATDGGESDKTTAFIVTTPSTVVPTPACALGYSTATQEFSAHVLPGPDGPSGVTWHLKIGTVNPPTTEATASASTSTALSYPSAQSGGAVTFYARVWGTKAGWTASAESAVASATRPALDSGGSGGPPIDPT